MNIIVSKIMKRRRAVTLVRLETSDEIDIKISKYRFSVFVKGKYRLIDHVRTTHRGDLEVCVSAMWIYLHDKRDSAVDYTAVAEALRILFFGKNRTSAWSPSS